jgi:hypothetical protein
MFQNMPASPPSGQVVSSAALNVRLIAVVNGMFVLLFDGVYDSTVNCACANEKQTSITNMWRYLIKTPLANELG